MNDVTVLLGHVNRAEGTWPALDAALEELMEAAIGAAALPIYGVVPQRLREALEEISRQAMAQEVHA